MAHVYNLNVVEASFRRYVSALASLGYNTNDLVLIKGSKANGNPWKVCYVDPESGGQSDAPGTFMGFLGYTKEEAHKALTSLARAFEFISYMPPKSQ